MADDDEEYFLPLEDQRVFGAGIKRRRIAFVSPSSSRTSIDASRSHPAAAPDAGDLYLSIVLPQGTSHTITATAATKDLDKASEVRGLESDKPLRCSVCDLPIHQGCGTSEDGATIIHDSSIAHQVCLAHSHPPSHLDHNSAGLKYLSNYGWDPYSRVGLGARADGIRAPVRSKLKNNTVGLGVKLQDCTKAQKRAPIRLNAKQTRKQEADGKRREAMLRQTFYGKVLEEYLGSKD